MAFDAPWSVPGDPVCCCCCLYPWPGQVGFESYPLADLPDTLVMTINGTDCTLTKVPASSPYEYSGTFMGDAISLFAGEDPGDTWLFSVASPSDITGQDNTQCLISDYEATGPEPSYIVTVADEFLENYTVDLGGGDSGVVTRSMVDICTWTGTSGLGVDILLYYNSSVFKWQVNGNNKVDPQNTPVGSYAGGITVS